MVVRGSVFLGLRDFASQKHPDKYEDWILKLPEESVNILGDISHSSWYGVEEALLKPLEVLCDLVIDERHKVSWDVGRHSAQTALKGIYRVFVAVSSPKFILKRAARVMSTFYNPTEVSVETSSDNSFLLHCTKLPVNDVLIDYRIAGWIECAGEICGCTNIKVEILSSMAFGDDALRIRAAWD